MVTREAKSTHLFSVIIPVYNAAMFVTDTLQSVNNQTYRDFELVIVDDGSSDDTLEVIESARRVMFGDVDVKVLCAKHKGPGHARNLGIEAAVGDWLAFLDSDDIWVDNRLAVIAGLISDRRELTFIHNDEWMIGIDGVVRRLEYAKQYKRGVGLAKQLYRKNIVSTSSLVVRKTALGGQRFDEVLMSAQDYELWLRIASYQRPLFISDKLTRYIDRRGSISRGKRSRRFMNECKISIRHRDKVGLTECWKKLVTLAMRYALLSLKNWLGVGV